MKKVFVYSLVSLIFLSGFLLIVSSTPYLEAKRRNQADCNKQREECRQYALESDDGTAHTTLMLTTCDVAWGWCSIAG
jgi:hypothetical protein